MRYNYEYWIYRVNGDRMDYYMTVTSFSSLRCVIYDCFRNEPCDRVFVVRKMVDRKTVAPRIWTACYVSDLASVDLHDATFDFFILHIKNATGW